ncbi:SPW repeat domain-containing protein [Sulfitobacter sp.]|uniref:SPW repeat domain-containing protein n=1 Tax=Sulfitobacter sp. TaxID=1903071 RepID=UPI0030035D36
MNKTLHAYLDYPVGLGLIVMPFVFGLGGENTLALWLSVITGVAAFILTVFTDHHLGLVRVLPYKLHLMVDFLVGIAFMLAPSILGFSGLDATYYWLIGATVLIVVALDNTQDAVTLE